MKKPKAEVRPIVLVVKDGAETRELEFKQDSIILGSGPTANVVLEDESVSSIHAIIKVTIEAATVIDLGSDTGTKVNGVETREKRLKDGDVLMLGEVTVEVQLPNVTTAGEPATIAENKVGLPKDRTVNVARSSDDEVTGTDTVAMMSPFSKAAEPSINAEPKTTQEGRRASPPPAPMKAEKSRASREAEEKALQRVRDEERAAKARDEEKAAAAAKAREEEKAAAARAREGEKAAAAAKARVAEKAKARDEERAREDAKAQHAKAKKPEKKAAKPVAPVKRPPPPVTKSEPVSQRSDATEMVRERIEDDGKLPELDGELAGIKVSNTGIPVGLLDQPLPKSERASKDGRTLQVALFWGNELQDVRYLPDGAVCTIGEAANNTFQLSFEGLPATMVFVHNDGTVVVPDGVNIEARAGKERLTRDNLKVKGRLKPIDAPVAAGGFRLGMDERIAVQLGAVTLVASYVSPAETFVTPFAQKVDEVLVSTGLFVGLFSLFMFMMVLVAPRGESEAADDLFKNSQRFARLMLKEEQKTPKKSFELSGKKGAKAKDESGKLGKQEQKTKDASASAKGTPAVDPNRREKDRKVALNSGLLKALGGKSSAMSNVFGPGGLNTGINAALGGLKGQATGDAGGLAGMGSRGTGPGAAGGSVGIGGIGNSKNVGTGGLGNVDLGGRGRSERSVDAGKTVVTGGLSQEAIKRVLDRAQSQLRYCYEKELQRVADLNGKVTVKFTIGGTGAVADANVSSTTLQNSNAEECMLRVFRRLRFPSPAGGGMVDVSYPMIYKPLGD